MSAKVPNVKQQEQSQSQPQTRPQQQQGQQSLQSKKKQSSSTTTKTSTHKSSNNKATKMTTASGFVAPNAGVIRSSTSSADLNHTATEAKEVEAVDVASDALYCGSSTQQPRQQQQHQKQQKHATATDDPQPPPRAAPRGNPPTPKPRSVLPPTTTLMATTTPAITTATLINSSSATSKATTTTAPMQHATVSALKMTENVEPHTTPRSKQRLIKVDFSLLQDDDNFFDEPTSTVRYGNCNMAHVGVCSQPQMPPYPIGGYMTMSSGYGAAASSGGVTNPNMKSHAATTQLPSALTTRVLRRTSI